MHDAWDRKPTSKQWTDALPPDFRPLATMPKRTSPPSLHSMPENVHRPKIPRHRVVSIVTLQNAPQPCPGLLHRLVHPIAQHLLNLLQLCYHPLVRRLSPNSRA